MFDFLGKSSMPRPMQTFATSFITAAMLLLGCERSGGSTIPPDPDPDPHPDIGGIVPPPVEPEQSNPSFSYEIRGAGNSCTAVKEGQATGTQTILLEGSDKVDLKVTHENQSAMSHIVGCSAAISGDHEPGQSHPINVVFDAGQDSDCDWDTEGTHPPCTIKIKIKHQ